MRRALLLAALLCATPALAEPDGRYLYVLTCSGCHGPHGSGSHEGRIPALTGSIGHFMKTAEARQFLTQAPGIMTSGLKDDQVAALMNWMVPAFSGSSLSGDFVPYSKDEIAQARKTRPADFFKARRTIVDELKAIGAELSDY